MEKERAILTPYAMETVPRAGDREIRMRPVPAIYQTRPRQKKKT